MATDDHNTRERAKAFFGDKIGFSDQPIVHSGNQQTIDTTGKPRTVEGLQAVIFDMWMLGEADKLFVTGMVTNCMY